MKSSGIIFTAKRKTSILGLILIIISMLSVLLFSAHQAAFVSSPRAVAQSPSSQNAVNIQNMQFSPGQITIAAGTMVTWTNKEMNIPHTVTSDSGLWDSGVLQPGQSFSRMFSTPGTFPYHCNIHPFMHGTVVVTAKSPSSSSQITPSTPMPSMTTSFPPPYPTQYPMPTSSIKQYPMTSVQNKPAGIYRPTFMRIIRVSPSVSLTIPAKIIKVRNQQIIIQRSPNIIQNASINSNTTNINTNVNQNIHVQNQTQTQYTMQSVSISR